MKDLVNLPDRVQNHGSHAVDVDVEAVVVHGSDVQKHV
eukprot:CAMPEP_0198587162 /NCGR_PEP_ID=MMETSP1462-20131121/131507_1 /TAXON_ID=1333877 /ORGANISM="Brandtodinium nutriculum, Strain RCC3387" /LENGTH=37 /DNA_ID= /DNA_START= /DNA_END= /DNA_ORIENTATION=